MTIGNRLREFQEYKKLTQRSFGEAIGSGKAFVANAGKSIRSDKLVQVLEAFPELNATWLMTGKGNMLEIKGKKTKSTREDFLKQKETTVPLINTTVVDKLWDEEYSINDQDIQEFYTIPKFKYSKVDFLIEVHGDSMAPRYKSGDIVACSIIRNNSFIQWNRPHMISTKGQGIMIKRIGQGLKEDQFTMVADNPAFPSFEIPKTEINGIALIIGGVIIE